MDISNVILSSNYGLPHPLTAQTIFDKCASHLIHQGKRSIGTGGCRYRSPDGSACAVGALIADDRYIGLMEFKPASEVIAKYMPELSKFATLLRKLQNLHDLGTYIGKFHNPGMDAGRLVSGLRSIAREFGLSAEVLRAPIAPTLPAEITSLLRPSLAKTDA